MTLRWREPRLPDKPVAVFTNTADYASIVHNGATLRSGTDLPPREFMTGAFGERNDFDAEAFFISKYERSDRTRTDAGNLSIARTFRLTANQANKEIKLLIRSPIWDWPRETRRRSGRTARSPRDIVDSRNLLRSQQPVRYES